MSTPLADLLRHIKDDTNDARLCELWITNMEDDEDCGSVEASITMPSTGCQPGQETHDDYCSMYLYSLKYVNQPAVIIYHLGTGGYIFGSIDFLFVC